MTSSRTTHGVPCSMAGLFGAGALAVCLSADAQQPQYGPLKSDGDYPAAEKFWTRINKNGVTAWRIAAEEALRERGFAEGQIKKLVRLQIDTKLNRPGPDGIVKISGLDLPMRFNTETGEKLPFDPVAYAKALPACYAQDERTCKLIYSATEYTTDDTEKPCRLPKRTVQFCKRVGFVNRYALRTEARSARTTQYRASCGEELRGSGCGADQVVFDAGEAQTKLAFNVAQVATAARASPPAHTTAAQASPPAHSAAVPASPPAPAKPNIVYHTARTFPSFARREGPPALEEWEYDLKAWFALQKQTEKPNANFDKIQATVRQRFGKALEYCWPHDVFHPCDVE